MDAIHRVLELRPPNALAKLGDDSKVCLLNGKDVVRVLRDDPVIIMACNARIKHVIPGIMRAAEDLDATICFELAKTEGETEHDDVVISHASRKIADLALEFDKPVGLGITGPGMSRLQAEARIERSKAAVEAVVKLHKALK